MDMPRAPTFIIIQDCILSAPADLWRHVHSQWHLNGLINLVVFVHLAYVTQPTSYFGGSLHLLLLAVVTTQRDFIIIYDFISLLYLG